MPLSKFLVKEGESGSKLSVFLHTQLPHLSLNYIKRGIESNKCTINGRVQRFHTTLVGKGDKIEFDAQEKAQIKKEVLLYEDEYYKVIDKPSGMASEKILGGKLAHRLDKETTGCLLFAKTDDALKESDLLFKNRQVEKSYLAAVEGIPAQASGVIEKPMAKMGAYQGQSVWGVDKKGLYAKTSYQILKKGKKRALLLCQPETGRTHQIRVHLASIGHPILGDFTYNKREPFSTPSERILLHAYEIKFIHPFTKKVIHVQSPIPPEIEELFP